MTGKGLSGKNAIQVRVKQTGKANGEIWHARRDGGVFPTLMQNSLLRDETGTPVGIIGTLRDITDLKGTEEALRKESSFRNGIIQRAAEGLCVCHGTPEEPFVRFTVWNDRMTEITGYTIDEINRLGWYQTMYPDPVYQEHARQRMEAMRGGDDLVSEEWTITRADGDERVLLISTSVLDIGAGERHVLAMMQDVTECQLAARALRESEQRYRSIFEQSPELVVLLDAQGTILEANRKAREWFVNGEESWLGKNFLELPLWTAQTRAQVADVFSRRLDGEGIPPYDLHLVDANGQQRVVRIHGTTLRNDADEVTQVLILVSDITAQYRARAKIVGQNRILAGINRVLEAAIRCDRGREVEKTCLAVAQELTESIFGFIGELNAAGRLDTIALSNPGWEACQIPRSDATKMIRNMEVGGIWGRVFKDGESLIVNEPDSHPDSVGTPEGHLRLTSFLGVPLKHGEKTIGIVALANKAVGYDSSDQKTVEALSLAFAEALVHRRAEESLKASETQLSHVGRVTTLGEMAGGLAHELCQPLSNIATWAEVAARNSEQNTDGARRESQEALGGIVEQVQRAGDIMRRIRMFATKSLPRKSTTPISTLINEVCALMNKEVNDASVALTLDVDPDSPDVLADGIQIQQVLVNLMRNAIMAMEATDPSARRLKIATKRQDDTLHISVSDTGHGIPQDQMKDIFEAFYTTKADGTGLGLSISRTIIERHKGRIWATPNASLGLTVYFTLPLDKSG